MNTSLAKMLVADSTDIFFTNLINLLNSYELIDYSVWEVVGTLVQSVYHDPNTHDATFDLFDFKYKNKTHEINDLKLTYFDTIYEYKETFFISHNESAFFAITFKERLSELTASWLETLCPYLGHKMHLINTNNRSVQLFIGYQKKLDFMQSSGHILKSITNEDVIINTLNFFNETFRTEISCAFHNGHFTGLGIDEVDSKNSLFINDIPLAEFAKLPQHSQFITEAAVSNRFRVNNILLIHEESADVKFFLFNIPEDTVPDNEMTALITQIISIAFENANHHRQATALKIEQAEMSQTEHILNKFVTREIKGGNIFCMNYPAKSTGGDYATVQAVSADEVFICVADVCGKGYSAAILTVMLATVLESGLINLRDSLSKVVVGLNNYLLSKELEGRFITGIFCKYNSSTREFSYISCGHEPPIIISNGQFISLASENLPLGIMEESYEISSINIKKDDLLFIYTDGVIEYTSYNKLQKMLVALSDNSPETIVKTIYKELVDEPENQRDDFTCVAIKF